MRSTGTITAERVCASVYCDVGQAGAAKMQRESNLSAEIAGRTMVRRQSQAEGAKSLNLDQGRSARAARGTYCASQP